MKVRLHPEAELEFRDAVIWYYHQGMTVGIAFDKAVTRAIERIRSSPEAYPHVYRSVRRIIVRRFPFALFYEILDDEILILAIFHSKRDPARWRRRN